MSISSKIIEQHGLKPDEYVNIKKLLKREPNLLELGIFSAMWNEHCSYKSSRKHLKNLPTKGDHVIQGPGENAGVIDIGDDDAIVFKIESHNHPSFIEPYQGAATGVGGIMRDVFTMGARPIANLNSIHFGSPQNKKTKNPNELLGVRKDLTPKKMAEFAQKFKDAGATILGGCCETRPSHINAFSQLK